MVYSNLFGISRLSQLILLPIGLSRLIDMVELHLSIHSSWLTDPTYAIYNTGQIPACVLYSNDKFILKVKKKAIPVGYFGIHRFSHLSKWSRFISLIYTCCEVQVNVSLDEMRGRFINGKGREGRGKKSIYIPLIWEGGKIH